MNNLAHYDAVYHRSRHQASPYLQLDSLDIEFLFLFSMQNPVTQNVYERKYLSFADEHKEKILFLKFWGFLIFLSEMRAYHSLFL